MPKSLPGMSRTRLAGSYLLLAAWSGTMQALSADELALEKQRVQQQSELESAGRVATSGVVTLSLEGADFDTRLAVYAGGCPSAESAIACNDDYHGLQSRVEFAACAGQGYRVRIGGYTDGLGNTATGSGPITLSLAPMDAPLAPQNLAIQLIGTDVHLTWDPVVSNELGCALDDVLYTVIAGDANGSWIALATTTPSAYLPWENLNNTTRTYRVIAGTPNAVAVSAGQVPVSFHGNTVVIDNGRQSK